MSAKATASGPPRPSLTVPVPVRASDAAEHSGRASISDDDLLGALASPAAASDNQAKDMHSVLARLDNERLEKQWGMTKTSNGEFIDLAIPDSPGIGRGARRMTSRQRARFKQDKRDQERNRATLRRLTVGADGEGEQHFNDNGGTGVPGEENVFPVDWHTKLAMGLADSAPQTFNFVASFYLQYFLLEQACVAPNVAGGVMLLAGLGVVLSDIFVFGLASSSSTLWLLQGPFGRPRALVFGPPLLALGYFLMWTLTLSEFATDTEKLFYFLGAYVCVGVGGGAIQRTTAHLNIMLTPTFEERTSMASYRIGLGNALAFACLMGHAMIIRNHRTKPTLFSDVAQGSVEETVHDAEQDRLLDQGFQISGYVFSGYVLITGWIACYLIRTPTKEELAPGGPPTAPPSPTPMSDPTEAYAEAVKNVTGEENDRTSTGSNGSTPRFSIRDVKIPSMLKRQSLGLEKTYKQWKENTYGWQEGRVKFKKALTIACGNRAFRDLTLTLFLGLAAIVMFEAYLLLYLMYRVKMSYNFVQIVAVTQLSKLVFMPYWSYTANLRGAVTAYWRGAVLMATAWFLLVFLQDGGFLAWHVLVFCGVIGASSSAVIFVPCSMLPDVVDDDFLKGEEKHGRRMRIFRSVWSLVEKLTVVFTLGLSNFALAAMGYKNPEAKCVSRSQASTLADQAETGDIKLDFIISDWNIDSIRTLMAGGPAVLILLSALAMYRYPITKNVAKENYQVRVRTNSIRRASCDQDQLERALALANAQMASATV